MLAQLKDLTARMRRHLRHLFLSLLLIPGHLTALDAGDTGNPILDPIFGFFRSIWQGLSNLWTSLVRAISNWFWVVLNYKYMGIPVGPLLFIAIGVGALMMVWGFWKLRQFLRTD